MSLVIPNSGALTSALGAAAAATTLVTSTIQSMAPLSTDTADALELAQGKVAPVPFTHGHWPYVEMSPSDEASSLSKRSSGEHPKPEPPADKPKPNTAADKPKSEPAAGKKFDLGHELCRFRIDDAEDARDVWRKTGAGDILDKFVKEMDANNETQWLRQFQEVYLGDPNYLNCDNLGDYTCQIDHKTCNQMAEDGLAGHYWVLRAVASMNKILLHLKDSINIKKEYFDMTKLADNFDSGEDSLYTAKRALESIADAFKIANKAELPIQTFTQEAQDTIGVVEILNPASKLDLVSEVLAGVTTSPALVSEIEIRGKVWKLSDLLKDLGQRYPGVMERHLQRLMWTATGNQDRSNLPQNLLSDGTGHKTDIAKLFGDGKWLLEGITFNLQPFVDESMLLVSQKFLIDSLRATRATMFVDAQNLDDWCEGEIKQDGFITHQHMELGLGKKVCIGIQQQRYKFLTVEQEALMANDFHMNTDSIYRHLWDCAKDSRYIYPDTMEVMPVGEMKTDGSLPKCFLAMEVFMGNRMSWVGNRKDTEQWLVNDWTSEALITRENMFSNGTWSKWKVSGLGIDLPKYATGKD
ncbi:unnamed protein product [Clonostachys rosea]|uniref:Uncharacterized protein n=1 Tax=Bionectria ochroleuca TaxID=29856 RepID=A0ABY6V3J8_BIOOC|nr:unnamed protein product [Clonostachys rosea]